MLNILVDTVFSLLVLLYHLNFWLTLTPLIQCGMERRLNRAEKLKTRITKTK